MSSKHPPFPATVFPPKIDLSWKARLTWMSLTRDIHRFYLIAVQQLPGNPRRLDIVSSTILLKKSGGPDRGGFSINAAQMAATWNRCERHQCTRSRGINETRRRRSMWAAPLSGRKVRQGSSACIIILLTPCHPPLSSLLGESINPRRS